MRKLLCALLAAVMGLAAAELTGKWSGPIQFTGPEGSNEAEAYMDLKANGAGVTGTVGPNADEQVAISKGKLDGKNVSFEVVLGSGETVKFELVLDGDTLQGTAKSERFSVKLNLKRRVS